ncbi:hypothetical protein RchiOBHm_Chr0c44g0503581 [Rosa chinensis]|uniref:Uncharacterized protein n=1 Tax=Rosa chinensis TaxID=74649 RepID=A0A2P6SQ23_ROSCH|nr:hypothetical protein RchiOBHm_Chr0c44g0503581 [Rosa chinensis]
MPGSLCKRAARRDHSPPQLCPPTISSLLECLRCAAPPDADCDCCPPCLENRAAWETRRVL